MKPMSSSQRTRKEWRARTKKPLDQQHMCIQSCNAQPQTKFQPFLVGLSRLQVDGDMIEFQRLGKARQDSGSEAEGDSEKEAAAVQINSFQKDR